MSSRREFMISAGAGVAAATLGMKGFGQIKPGTTVADFAKWKGFFVGSFGPGRQGLITRTASLEDDYLAIADWGFNAVRPRIDYTQWLNYTDQTPQGTPYSKDFYNIKESFLALVDDAINLALKHKLRVLLAMFHAPGYDGRDNGGRNDYTGPYNLWIDKVAQDAFAYYWGMFAKRYAGISADVLAFDLVNEPCRSNARRMSPRPSNFVLYPTGCTNEIYTRVMTMAVNKIREASPDRPIFAEGLDDLGVADQVVPELIPLGVGQSIHPYYPGLLTHFDIGGASSNAPIPTWPYKQIDGTMFGPEQLAELYKPFGDLTKQSIPVLCGEFGVSARTPNDVAMRFTADMLELFKTYQIGWMYWDLRGIPGAPPYRELSAILDSTRRDVRFEFYRDQRGNDHSLNLQMLKLLQKYL